MSLINGRMRNVEPEPDWNQLAIEAKSRGVLGARTIITTEMRLGHDPAISSLAGSSAAAHLLTVFYLALRQKSLEQADAWIKTFFQQYAEELERNDLKAAISVRIEKKG